MANLPSKLVAEFYLPSKSPQEKKRLLYRYTVTGFKSLDDALRRAKEYAQQDGKRVVSANFRMGDDGQIEAIVANVELEARK